MCEPYEENYNILVGTIQAKLNKCRMFYLILKAIITKFTNL